MNPDINAEILAELRSMRRHNQLGAYFTVLMVLIFIAYISWSVRERQSTWSGRQQSQSAPRANVVNSEEIWSKISAALDDGDNQEALSIARNFVARRPNYYYSHATLGSTYIAIGDFTNAEAAYARVVDLYPDEEYEKALAAVRKRLARDNSARSK
jgi:tetratricopeptide (TPR) repeat protein